MRGKVVSVAEFRALWFDLSLSMDQIAERLGVTRTAVVRRAAHRGLPNRSAIWRAKSRTGHWGAKPTVDAALFRELWLGGAPSAEIVRRCGIYKTSSARIALRLGLPARPLGPFTRAVAARWREQIVAERLASGMAEVAAVETRLERDARMGIRRAA